MLELELNRYKCALFDLDGVVFDTEGQYSIFWKKEFERYRPDTQGMEHQIKGRVLTEILSSFFPEAKQEWSGIIARLNAWEASMKYEYIAGFEEFIALLKKYKIKTAVVTSSNRAKMESVYEQHPEFKSLFDDILTAEDFDKSKPDPDCYLKGMARFACTPEETLVLEDSVNGLKSGLASGATLIGLVTTNPETVVREYTTTIIKDYR